MDLSAGIRRSHLISFATVSVRSKLKCTFTSALADPCVTRLTDGVFMKIAILLAGLLLPAVGQTQSYSIDWYKVSGGGGTSTGGVFSVNGTIGQHDAGQVLAGGDFSITGGFWSI